MAYNDPLSQLQNMAREPKFWESNERNEDNNEYNNKPTISLYEQKKDFLKGFYWNSESKWNITDLYWEQENTQEQVNNSELNNQTKQNKYLPVINRLLESWEITGETYNILLDNSEENFWSLDVANLVINQDQKTLVEWLVESLNNNSKENILKFSWDIAMLEEFEDYDTYINDWKIDEPILNMIWENYIEIPEKNWSIDKTKDILTAVKTTKSDLLNKYTNINQDCQTYITAINNIENWNLKLALEWINSLYVLWASNAWKLAKKETIKYTGKRKEQLKNKAEEITNALVEAKQNNNEKEIKKLNSQKKDIIVEAKEIDSWDIFEAGDFDKISEEEGNIKEQA